VWKGTNQNIYSNREKLSGRSEELFKIPIGLNPNSNQGQKWQNMQTRSGITGLKKTTYNMKNNKITKYVT
jgi:hypothetical protein